MKPLDVVLAGLLAGLLAGSIAAISAISARPAPSPHPVIVPVCSDGLRTWPSRMVGAVAVCGEPGLGYRSGKSRRRRS